MEESTWKPNKLGAIILSLISPGFGMLYLCRKWYALFYFFALTLLVFYNIWFETKEPNRSVYFLLLQFIAVWQAYQIIKSKKEIKFRPWYSQWYWLLTLAFIFTSLLFSIKIFFFELYSVPTNSMYPSIPKGSIILSNKWGCGNYKINGITIYRSKISRSLQSGDILSFEFPQKPGTLYIKRLIGLPGDHLEYKNKTLSINGKILETIKITTINDLEIEKETNYNIAKMPSRESKDFNLIVEPGHLFLLEDNRDNSMDSREWGQIPYNCVTSKILCTLKKGN